VDAARSRRPGDRLARGDQAEAALVELEDELDELDDDELDDDELEDDESLPDDVDVELDDVLDEVLLRESLR
jgi:hypothetical protein